MRDARSGAAVCLFVLFGGAACQATGAPGGPTAPVDPFTPATPEFVIGFEESRVELVEGEGAALLIRLELTSYPVAREPLSTHLEEGFDVPVILEAVTADGQDLQVPDGIRFRAPGGVPLRKTAWLALRAPPDGIAEGVETLKLRLGAPRFKLQAEPTPAVRFENAEAEVVIRDGSDSCGDVEIRALRLQRVTSPEERRGLHEVEILVEADVSSGWDIDVAAILQSGVTIGDWRTAISGSRVSHRIRFDWSPSSRQPDELRFAPCAADGGGPVLVCTIHACRLYAPGEPVPPPA